MKPRLSIDEEIAQFRRVSALPGARQPRHDPIAELEELEPLWRALGREPAYGGDRCEERLAMQIHALRLMVARVENRPMPICPSRTPAFADAERERVRREKAARSASGTLNDRNQLNLF